MSQISITKQHNKSLAEARKAVNRVAKGIADKFSVQHQWEGDTLHFTRSGVDGHIALDKGAVTVHVVLGFFLMALRGPVEREISIYLDREFGD